jgi:hypothetical protein
LIATGILSALHLSALVVFGFVMASKHNIGLGGEAIEPLLGLLSFVFISVLSGVIILGGLRMMQFENYGLAVLASILAIPASFPYLLLLGLPAAIWALVVLRRPEVRLAFARKVVHTRLSHLSNALPAAPTGPLGGRIRSMFGAFRSLVFGSRVQDNYTAQNSGWPSPDRTSKPPA